MNESHPRHIHFESVPNFRDLGGYRTHDGRTVAWRRLFRSAAIHKINDRDMARLKQEISPRGRHRPEKPEGPREGPRASPARGNRRQALSHAFQHLALVRPLEEPR
jgi:hypothetical protein